MLYFCTPFLRSIKRKRADKKQINIFHGNRLALVSLWNTNLRSAMAEEKTTAEVEETTEATQETKKETHDQQDPKEFMQK